MSEEKEQICNPQHIVINTLRAKIVNFDDELVDLSERLGDLGKTLEARTGELNIRHNEADRQISEMKERIENIQQRITDLEIKFAEVNDFLKETKIKWGIWKKCLIFMKEFPGHVVAFLGAITAIIMYLIKFLGL